MFLTMHLNLGSPTLYLLEKRKLKAEKLTIKRIEDKQTVEVEFKNLVEEFKKFKS